MLRWLGWGVASCFRSRLRLVAENICLRQQLVMLRCRRPRLRLRDADRRFRVLACRWFAAWRGALPIVTLQYRAAVASQGLESLLAVAFQTEKKDRAPSDCARGPGPHSPLGRREPPLGPTQDPGGVGETRLRSVCP